MTPEQAEYQATVKRISARLSRITPLLAIAALIIVLAAAKIAATVVLPLAFGLFLVALFWPLQRRLQARMPRGLAVLATFLLFLLIVVAFLAAFWWGGRTIAAQWPQYADEFNRYLQLAQGYGLNVGIPPASGPADQQGSQLGHEVVVRIADTALALGGASVLVIAYLLLGLLEVYDYRVKLDQILPAGEDQRWLALAHRVTSDFQRYIVVRTAIGLLNGVLAGLAAWLIGLDFAFTWGLVTFLFNYIPTLGSVVAVVFPVLFALVQFSGWEKPLLTLVALGGVQTVLGMIVDPLIEGKYLGPSPLVVLLSVAFWGWLWGIPGAFIGVPLTILVIVTCQQFDRTRWIAILLAGVKDENKKVANNDNLQKRITPKAKGVGDE